VVAEDRPRGVYVVPTDGVSEVGHGSETSHP
jgi:hypothetical protein